MSKHQAIRETHDTVVTIRGNDKSDIVALDNNGKNVNINWEKVNNHISSSEYKTKRKSEYPTHEDCIHALLDGGDTLTELQEKRQEIKAKYPKP